MGSAMEETVGDLQHDAFLKTYGPTESLSEFLFPGEIKTTSNLRLSAAITITNASLETCAVLLHMSRVSAKLIFFHKRLWSCNEEASR